MLNFGGANRQFDRLEMSIAYDKSDKQTTIYDSYNRELASQTILQWYCNGSSVAPLNEYMNNPIYQELPDEEKYFGPTSDERVYLDLRSTSGYVKQAEKLESKNKSAYYAKKYSQ